LQIHIVQGHEPAAFLNLFSGGMVVHSSKKFEKKCEKRCRLYICRGTLEAETFLIEIPCSTRHLRNRGSFILINTENAKLYVWHGNNSLRHIREVYFLQIFYSNNYNIFLHTSHARTRTAPNQIAHRTAYAYAYAYTRARAREHTNLINT